MSKKESIINFVDTETTGLDWRRHEIISVGVVIARERELEMELLDEFEVKIKPEHLDIADPIAFKINKYTSEAWQDGVSKKEAGNVLWQKLYTPAEGNYGAIINGVVVGGHNVHFDLLFIAKLFADSDKTFYPRHLIDTYMLSKRLFKRNNISLDSYALGSLCNYFDIENKNAHTALADARASFKLYKRLLTM